MMDSKSSFEINSFDLDIFLGMTEKDAIRLIKSMEMIHRVVARNSLCRVAGFGLLGEYNLNRINLHIEYGKITWVTCG